MKKFMNNAGFTLVELIVVIAILGILAAVAVPAYTGYMDKAKEASDTQTVAAMNTAFAAAMTECMVTANDIEDVSVTDNGSVDGEQVSAIVVTMKTAYNATESVRTAKADEIEAAFLRYFTGNETVTMKYYKSFDWADGNFTGSPTE